MLPCTQTVADAISRLEVDEFRAVHESRDDFTHVVGLAVVDWRDARDLIGVEQRRLDLAIGQGRAALIPIEATDDVARNQQTVCVVVGKIFDQPRHGGVHFGRSQFPVIGNLAGGRTHQRRPAKRGHAIALDAHDVIAEAGLVGAAGRRKPMQHGQRRDARSTQQRPTIIETAAVRPGLDGILQQVGAGTFDQVDERQLVLQRDVERTDDLRNTRGRDCAGIDATVVCHDEAAHAADEADAADEAAARDARFAIGVFDQEIRQVVQLDTGQARVQKAGQAFARRELRAFLEPVATLFGQCFGACLISAQPFDERQHVRAVRVESVGPGIDLALKDGHAPVSKR